MTRNSQTLAVTMIGAVLGGMAGYLFLTDRGRALRRQLDPALDDFARELGSLRSTVQKAITVASEGWAMLDGAAGDGDGGRTSARYPAPHQTTPF